MALALVVASSVDAGCGRTELDWEDGPPVVVGTGGRGAGGRPPAGSGGRIGVGAGGFVFPPSPGIVPCGFVSCRSEGSACCLGAGGDIDCVAAVSGSCMGVASVACDEPADCSSRTCCAGVDLDGATPFSSRCAAAGTCTGAGRFVVCRSNADCPGTAPACCADFGVSICLGRCGS